MNNSVRISKSDKINIRIPKERKLKPKEIFFFFLFSILILCLEDFLSDFLKGLK